MADRVTVQINPHQNAYRVQRTNHDGMAAARANSFYGLSLHKTLPKLRKGSRFWSSDTVFQLEMSVSNRKQTLCEDVNHCRRCFGVCHTRMRDNTLSDVVQTQSTDDWIGSRSMLLVFFAFS